MHRIPAPFDGFSLAERNRQSHLAGVLTLLLQSSGWIVAHTPEVVWRATSVLLGEALLWLLPRRRRVTASNLHHAFPERSRTWRRRIARESSRRLIETSLLSLASPHFTVERIRRSVTLAPAVTDHLQSRVTAPRPVVFATLHVAYWESQAWLAALTPLPPGEFGVIFRPLKQPAVDAYVKRTRERFGMQLLSRRAGFQSALRILRAGGSVALLFDQNAGDEGSLTLLFDRVCATSDLAGVLAARLGAEVWVFYPRRRAFWRIELETERVAHDGTPAGITLALNRWLERRLAGDEEFCASWLWAHDRWRTQDRPERRLRLEQKRNLLPADLTARGLTTLPRRTRCFIRLPNWLGDVVMALPLLRTLRTSRPDAEVTLIGKAAFAPLVERWGVCDHFVPLPPRGARYFRRFRQLREAHPDLYLLFTQSARADLEAWLTGCRQRFGVIRRGRRRPLLTHAYAPPPDFDEREHHQLELWEAFFRHFGLAGPLDRTPLSRPAVRAGRVGLIAGSENLPAKRWPVAHWRALIEARPNDTFVLFGTANDRPITDAVAAGFAPERVENLAGRTDLAAYMRQLQACELLVTNDTGGMHLANALGVPLVALFGPTNPVRTGPVFATPHQVLQPPGCPATGGSPLTDLAPATVSAAVDALRARLAATSDPA